MTDSEIIQVLGGVTAVARMLDIKPPSVHGWLETGIPEGRLRDLAAQIEIKSDGRFSRQKRWPEKYLFYWPELAQRQEIRAQDATENIANSCVYEGVERRFHEVPQKPDLERREPLAAALARPALER